MNKVNCARGILIMGISIFLGYVIFIRPQESLAFKVAAGGLIFIATGLNMVLLKKEESSVLTNGFSIIGVYNNNEVLHV